VIPSVLIKLPISITRRIDMPLLDAAEADVDIFEMSGEEKLAKELKK
jgi:hypothetical protein